MDYDRPLMIWLSGKSYYLKSPYYIENEDFLLESAWLSIDFQAPLHEAAFLKLRPFDPTWTLTKQYISSCCKILDRQIPAWNPSNIDAERILQELGPPPLRCYAIYLITVEQDANERCVYVGQTNSKHHRFRSGHAAISALHAPRYEGLIKRIYLAGIQVEDDDDHMFPVEWIHPTALRQQVLNSIELLLISELQPELNTRGRTAAQPALHMPLTIQNTVSKFLDAVSF